jgi:hypothetical protein
MAVADVTNQSLWVSVISLLSAAENLSEDQLCLAYEAASYAATMGLIEDTTLDANVLPWYAEGRRAWGRRLEEVSSDVNRSPAGVSYDQIFANLIITTQKDFKIAGLYSFPYMLLADAILVDPVPCAPTHQVTGERLGSATLRYRLAQHLGYSVLTLPQTVWTKLNDLPQKERLPAAADKVERWLSQLRARRQEALQTASHQNAQAEMKKAATTSEQAQKVMQSSLNSNNQVNNRQQRGNNRNSSMNNQMNQNNNQQRQPNAAPRQTPDWKEPLPPIQRRQRQQQMREQANQNQQQINTQQIPLPSFLQDDSSNTDTNAGSSGGGSSWAQELSSLIDSSTNTSNSTSAPKESKELPSFASFDIGSGAGESAKQEVPARPRPTLDEEI